MSQLLRALSFFVVLMGMLSSMHWLPFFLQGLNPVPVLLFLFLERRSSSEALILGGLAGGLVSLVFPGPSLITLIRYALEGVLAARLQPPGTASGAKIFGFFWTFMGFDLVLGLLSRLLLDEPLTIDLLKDWLVMDGVSGFLGTLLLFLWRYPGRNDRLRPRKHHGIGLPLP